MECAKSIMRATLARGKPPRTCADYSLSINRSEGNQQTTGEVLDPWLLWRQVERCVEAHTMANTPSRRLNLSRLLAPLALLSFLQTPGVVIAQAQAPTQHFACNVGYTPRDCKAATKVLSKALARYPVDKLGKWTWVLVRTEDWKQILSVRGFDTSHPAFSYLAKRETFLEGSLVAGASIRGTELSVLWHMPVEDLLDLAIRHELAHALCNEPDELKAERTATALKNGMPLSCRATPVAKNHTDETRNHY
jgi:hypothetical protein